MLRGGHLAHLMRLRGWWADHERHWVTEDTADSRRELEGERVTWARRPTTRSLPSLLRSTALARRVLADVRPDLVVSTGAGVAVPFFWLARAHGASTIYLEVFDRVDSRTITGRLCRPVSDLFLVQWPEQQTMYRDSVLLGTVWA